MPKKRTTKVHKLSRFKRTRRNKRTKLGRRKSLKGGKGFIPHPKWNKKFGKEAAEERRDKYEERFYHRVHPFGEPSPNKLAELKRKVNPESLALNFTRPTAESEQQKAQEIPIATDASKVPTITKNRKKIESLLRTPMATVILSQPSKPSTNAYKI